MEEGAFTIERVAKIAASLEIDHDRRADVLAANDLDEERWEELESAQDDALRDARARGDASKLERYDRAYLERIEEERGPISIEEYASVVRASRTGGSAARLEELEIPESAELPLMRIFEARLAEDEVAAHTLREALGE